MKINNKSKYCIPNVFQLIITFSVIIKLEYINNENIVPEVGQLDSPRLDFLLSHCSFHNNPKSIDFRK